MVTTRTLETGTSSTLSSDASASTGTGLSSLNRSSTRIVRGTLHIDP
jgi:hypothetical protein